jgi:hypothetical protein
MFSRCFKRGFPKKTAKLPECTGQNGLYMFHWCCFTLLFILKSGLIGAHL